MLDCGYWEPEEETDDEIYLKASVHGCINVDLLGAKQNRGRDIVSVHRDQPWDGDAC